MSVRKRNEFLDAGDSEQDDDLNSDYEAAADSRMAGLVARTAKRRRITKSTSVSDDESVFKGSSTVAIESGDPAQHEISRTKSRSPGIPARLSSTNKRLLTTKPSKPTHKPGVIYLSRIPPFMRPSTVKTLLSTHGPITKIFLTPEPPNAYLRRKKSGGNKKHSFIDGWVEFARKKHAKQCVDAINGQIVGGKKGGWYRDDVWNARYLRRFGWDDLMQSVRAEEREREEKVRVGTKREGRERGEFLKNLERSKVEATRREKKRKREGDVQKDVDDEFLPEPENGIAADHQPVQHESEVGKTKGFERSFRQNEVKGNRHTQPDQPDEVKRVLSKIF